MHCRYYIVADRFLKGLIKAQVGEVKGNFPFFFVSANLRLKFAIDETRTDRSKLKEESLGGIARGIQNDANIGLKAHPEYEITMNKLQYPNAI